MESTMLCVRLRSVRVQTWGALCQLDGAPDVDSPAFARHSTTRVAGSMRACTSRDELRRYIDIDNEKFVACHSFPQLHPRTLPIDLL